MAKKNRVMKLEKTVTFWKGFASGVASAIAAVAGIVCLVNYLIQIAQAVK